MPENAADFVLEIGTEEMPARFVPRLAEELAEVFAGLLAQARLDAGRVGTFATPRRIVVQVEDLALAQRREEEIVTGPPVKVAYGSDGSLSKAALGFARGQGVAEADLFKLSTDKGEYLAVRKQVGGAAALDILPGLCVQAVKGLNFPKKMRWGSQDFAFGRPIRWLLALLGPDVVPFELAGLASGRLTFGHRVMGRGPFSVPEAGQYRAIVENSGQVAIDPQKRLDAIRAEGDRLAEGLGGRIVWKDSLLSEVTNLVEFPRPILGRFDEAYLELPREVLLTSMESHQKSFGVEGEGGRLLPFFLCTLNIEPVDLDVVRKGWQRVLRARLEDARFFWEADLASGFTPWLAALEHVVFMGPLGSMADKARRLARLCALLAAECNLSRAEAAQVERAGLLAKADLVSEMVGEFDTLQGIMGGIYARRQGEDEAVARAVAEQYLPAGPDSPVPATLAGALVSLADKADNLAGCFGLDMIPTGAADPYALRRQALGICRILIEHGLRLSPGRLLALAQEGYGAAAAWKLPPAEARKRFEEFLAQRLRAYFTGLGHSTLVADSALGAGAADVRALSARVRALSDFSREPDFGQAVLTFKRAANIVRKQGEEANVPLTGAFDPALFEADEERELAARLAEAAPRFEALWARDDFPGLLGLLRELRPVVDAFFDHVMVICDDLKLRANRLNLLKALADMLGRLAYFNLMQV